LSTTSLSTLARFGALLIASVALYAPRDPLPPSPAAAAGDPKEKKATTPTDGAVNSGAQ